MIGQYSVLYKEEFLFTATAKSNVRLLTLDSQFFQDKDDLIDGMKNLIEGAHYFVDKFGLPICDFKVFQPDCTIRQRF